MNFKTLFVMIIVLISLGVFVDAKELTFIDYADCINCSFDISYINITATNCSVSNTCPDVIYSNNESWVESIIRSFSWFSTFWSLANFTSAYDSRDDRWILSNFTAAFEDELPTCAAGEYTTSDGTDLTCDTPAGTGGGGVDLYKGKMIFNIESSSKTRVVYNMSGADEADVILNIREGEKFFLTGDAI